MKKRVACISVFLLMVFSISAYAVESRVAGGSPFLTFDGRTAECSVTCYGNSSDDEVEATLTLYQGGTEVESWTASGIYRVSIAETCDVTRGKSYTLELTWALNGINQGSETVTKTCPLFG